MEIDPADIQADAGHSRRIEASLRRLAHYDYWSDRIKRSIILDSGADIISYGMGERSIVEIDGGAGCVDRGGRSHLSGRNGRKGEKSRFRL